MNHLIKKYAVFIMSLAIAAAGILILYWMVESYFEEQRYSADGQTGIGTVLAKQNLPSGFRTGRRYLISYEFTLKNIPPQKGENDVGRSVYGSKNIGDKIEVQYLASDPTTHRVLGILVFWHAAPVFVPVGLVLTLIGLAMFYPGIRQVSRQSHLSRLNNEGVALTARVTEFVCDKPNETEEKYKTFHIIYEYEGPDGETVFGKSKTHSRDWFSFQGTDIGGSIDILADPKNPKVSEWRKEMK